MRKWLKGVICLFALFATLTEAMPVVASNAGYYYESIDVQVVVDQDRRYHVTETLDVFYEESKHGIIRMIPNFSDVENYFVTDIHVEGAPYTVEDTYSGVDIRIGDPERTVKGLMTYKLSYTLEHYQDYDEFNDYVYLNLIGDDFDTEVKRLSASVLLPDQAEVFECTVNTGYYGSLGNNAIQIENEGNAYSFLSRRTIEPYEAITVQFQLQEGLFDQAPIYVFPYVIKEKNIDIEVTEEQDFIVNQHVVLDSNETYTTYPLDLEMEVFYGEDVEIHDFKGTVDGRQIDDEYGLYSVSMDNPGKHVLNFSYRMRLRKIQNGDIEFVLQNDYEETQVEKLHFSIQLPKIYTYAVRYNRWNDELRPERYEIEEKDNQLIFDSKSPLQAKEVAAITVNFNENDYYRPTPLLIGIMPFVSFLFLASVSILRLTRFKNKPLAAPVSFYPPAGINSAEAGYLIDNRLSDEDITSLIFSWAHAGSLRIENINKQFVLVKDKPLPQNLPYYEKRLFNQLFLWGESGRVSELDLKYHFYADVEEARKSILRKFTNEIPFKDKGALKAKKAMIAVSMLLSMILLTAVMIEEIGSFPLAVLFGGLLSLPMMIFVVLFTILAKVFRKTSLTKLAKTFLIFAIGIPLILASLMGLVFMDLYLPQVLTSFCFCAAAAVVALTMNKRTEEADRLLGELKGFKKFLTTAKKHQLELLLEENPEYFYEILPYAQTLKVTKIWQDKFEDIAMQPPTWYISTEVYSPSNFNRMTRNFSRSMVKGTARPISSGSSDDYSSGSGGGYSGSGGGFSSGGSSGGGSGGGGSRSW